MPIVAGVDQSGRAEAVINEGRALAEGLGVDLHVVHVEKPSADLSNISEGWGETPTEPPQPVLSVEEVRERAMRIAAEIADSVDDHGVVKTIGLVGNPAEELLTYSREHNAEYIVVCSRKRSKIGKVLFGSVTQSLLLSADRPIVAIPLTD